MDTYIQILVCVILGILLLWFGYSLFIGQLAGFRRGRQDRSRHELPSGEPNAEPADSAGADGSDHGDPQACPVCSAQLNKGELVKSRAFPSLSGGKDRLMHIRGCAYCLGDDGRDRRCPVCGDSLTEDDYLIARMFERANRRKHVHVQGCSRCKNG
jgi:hypothetical protein